MKTRTASAFQLSSVLIVIVGFVVFLVPVKAWSLQSFTVARAGVTPPAETGTISGHIDPPPGQQPALDLFLENLETDVVVIVPLEPGQASYSAQVSAGRYHAYTWLPSFDLMGGFTVCVDDPQCGDHTLRDIVVEGDGTVSGIDIVDWHVPETRLVALSGRLFDGTGSAPTENGIVVLWNRHIMAVGHTSELPIPPAAHRFVLPGTTILPGFINTHAHNSYRPDNLQAWATAGVTTVRDLGAPVNLRWDDLREHLAGDPRNARILAAGPLVTCPDGYPITGANFSALTVDSVEEAQFEIDSLIDRGADVIKIVIESGVPEVLSLELATAIVDTAHDRGIPVTVHINLERDLVTALDAGVDDVAHIALDYVPDSVLQRMVDGDVAWVPTLEVFEGNGTQMYDNLQRFVAAGGRVAMGNDGGYLAGVTVGMPTAEMEWMEFAGMTPMQIIVAATSDAAIVSNRQDLLGTLTAGKLADILVVEGDPLTDLRALEQPRLVIHEGAIIRNEMPDPRQATGRLQFP